MKRQHGLIELQLILYVVLFLGVTSVGAYIVHSIRQGERDKLAAETAKKEAARHDMISGLAIDLANARADATAARAERDNKLQEQQDAFNQRLHDYVPAGTQCLRAGFVRYTDAAARGVPPAAGPGPGPASAPSGIGDDVVAGIISRNYAKYHACERRVADLLSDFDKLRATYNAKVNEINASVKH